MSICSKDLRRRVINAVKSGATRAEAASRFGVSQSSVFRWQKRIDILKPGPKSSRIIDEDLLKAHIKQYPDAYLEERAEAFSVTASGIWRAMRRLGIHKKNVAIRRK